MTKSDESLDWDTEDRDKKLASGELDELQNPVALPLDVVVSEDE